MAKRYPLKPLKRFDYKLVEAKLDGLLINVDRDLQRIVRRAESANNMEASRCLGLLNVMVRFVNNSYRALRYVIAETPDDPARKPNYALIIAPVNRQLLDLLFSLVYMLDDFPTRSLRYQRAGWREAREEYDKFKTEFSRDPEWQPFFKNVPLALDEMAERFGISSKEQKKPSLVPFWKHPFKLKDEKAESRTFLRWLEKWLYGDTSAQAHLSFGGLIGVAPFLVAELVGGEAQQLVEGRMMQQYRFHQFSRTALVTLAIATEIDCYCNLGNREVISYLWILFSEHAAEGREMFKARYEAKLSSRSVA